MTDWVFRTDFITDKPLEHGNWSAVEFDTEEEAREWWSAKDTVSNTVRVMTLTNPQGQVVDTRKVGNH
jgi:hypothetical protein